MAQLTGKELERDRHYIVELNEKMTKKVEVLISKRLTLGKFPRLRDVCLAAYPVTTTLPAQLD